MSEEKRLTPLKAIRAKCLDCCCFQPSEVKKCISADCPIWPFRMGRNPARAGQGPRDPFGNRKSGSGSDEISKETLSMVDKSAAEFKKGNVGEPIELDKYVGQEG